MHPMLHHALRLEALTEILAHIKSIPCVRVSSAQARGKAKQYPYWGAVRYELRLNKKGKPCLYPLDRAYSDRRSKKLAERDAETIAKAENRCLVLAARGNIDMKFCTSQKCLDHVWFDSRVQHVIGLLDLATDKCGT